LEKVVFSKVLRSQKREAVVSLGYQWREPGGEV
jgi:hypothetical protein